MNETQEAMVLVALECIRICEKEAAVLEEGPVDKDGWPSTPEGAARHQSLALAAAIRESLEHETLGRLIESVPN